jgi:hypothetical protein
LAKIFLTGSEPGGTGVCLFLQSSAEKAMVNRTATASKPPSIRTLRGGSKLRQKILSRLKGEVLRLQNALHSRPQTEGQRQKEEMFRQTIRNRRSLIGQQIPTLKKEEFRGPGVQAQFIVKAMWLSQSQIGL